MSDECKLCRGSKIELVYGGHGTVLELPCSMCSDGVPCHIPDPSSRDCKNMKEVGGGMDGERYRCDVCGKGYFLDYEEMK